MNKDKAITFLLSHQPLPPDRKMPREMAETLDRVRRLFLDDPDTDCIRPFLNSFGEGDGLGIYPLIGDVLRKLPKVLVVEGLVESLQSPHHSVRYWSTQLAAEFPSLELVPLLLAQLKGGDYDLKYAALTAIEQSANRDTISELKMFLNQESDDELRTLTTEIVQSLQAK